VTSKTVHFDFDDGYDIFIRSRRCFRFVTMKAPPPVRTIPDYRPPSPDWTVTAVAEWTEDGELCRHDIPPMTIKQYKVVAAMLNGLADDLGDVVHMTLDFFPKRKGTLQ